LQSLNVDPTQYYSTCMHISKWFSVKL
jgi:hypothetical protein